MSTNESLNATGKAAAAAIVEMVEALECDYDRLEELAAEREEEMDAWREANPDADLDAAPPMDDELKDLIAESGECTSREEAEQRIQEDALSLEVRSGWHTPGDADGQIPEEFNILLSTGGPAVRIHGELDEHAQPTRAWLEVQDWGTPWTQYFDISQDTLLAYASCFYYGEG